MSESAKTLLFWVRCATNAANLPNNERDVAYCQRCARSWAEDIISGHYYSEEE